jgi:hypothetical protein
MNKPNLQTLLDARVEDPAKADRFFGIGKDPDAKWLKTIAPGLAASQKLVDDAWAANEFEEALPKTDSIVGDMEEIAVWVEKLRGRVRVPVDASAHEIIKAALEGKWVRKAMMLTPLNKDINPHVHYAHMAIMRRQPWLGYFQKTNSVLQAARNACAQFFLNSEAEWSLWADGDTIMPFNDPGFFYDKNVLAANPTQLPERFARFVAIDRLVSHGKSIVGGFYQQRAKFGRVCSPLDLKPNGDPDGIIAQARKQAQDRIVPVEWCATGCLLVHRRVYEDIMAKRPDLASKHEGGPFNFFGHDVGNGGEDAYFGKLAAEAGHQSYLDLGCWCCHLGTAAYWPDEQR